MDASQVHTQHIWVLVLLMLGAAILGGSINHFFYAEKREGKVARKTPWYACVLISAGAASLVPLFLTMIASSLVKECETDKQKYLVFFGFCVIAAISSRAFIGSLSVQVLDRIRRAEEKIEEVEPLVHKAKEPHVPRPAETHAAAAEDAAAHAPGEGPGRGLDARMRVLFRLGEGDYVFRTVDGVASSANLDARMCEDVLRGLRADGLVDKIDDVDGVRWYLTAKGWEVLEREHAPGALNGAAHTVVG